jgi:hypothetical protein
MLLSSMVMSRRTSGNKVYVTDWNWEAIVRIFRKCFHDMFFGRYSVKGKTQGMLIQKPYEELFDIRTANVAKHSL